MILSSKKQLRWQRLEVYVEREDLKYPKAYKYVYSLRFHISDSFVGLPQFISYFLRTFVKRLIIRPSLLVNKRVGKTTNCRKRE